MFESYHSDNLKIMLLQESVVNVGDNSGIIFAKIIKNLGGFFRRYSRMCNNVIVAARKKRNELLIKDKLFFAVIINIKKKILRIDGSYLNFKKNKVLLFNFKQRSKFLGKRILGPVSYEIKKYKLFNVLFFAKNIV